MVRLSVFRKRQAGVAQTHGTNTLLSEASTVPVRNEKSLIPLSAGLMELICAPFVNNAYWQSLMHKIPDKRIDDTES